MNRKFTLGLTLAIILALAVSMVALAQAPAPTITSDLPDYGPGDTVTLTGAGWAQGEAVHVYVNDDWGSSWNYSADPVADENGDFVMTFQLPNWFVATYSVTATGPFSGTATTTFTDGNLKFVESGLPSGTQWSVSWGTVTQFATISNITFGGQEEGPYTYTIPSVTIPLVGTYVPSPATGSETRPGNGTKQIDVTFTLTSSCTSPSVITNPANRSVTYGDNAVFSASASGDPSPSVQWQVKTPSDAGFSNLSGETGGSVTVTMPTVAQSGTQYRAVFTNTCGSATTAAATLTVGKKAASVTADNQSKTYGDDNPGLTATVVGQVTGGDVINYSLSTTAVKLSGVGDYPITVTLGSNPNYDVTATDGTLTVTKKAASVTPNAASKTYGEPDPAFTGTLSGFLVADSVTASYSREAGETVLGSPYKISATLSPTTVLSNYSITYNTANFTINPKVASVTPNVASKTYGAADPALTGTLSGFLVADSVAASYSRTPGETVAGSPYTISATLSPAGVLSNYTITYNTASFTINPKPASVTPGVAGKTYGDVDPTLTGTLSGFLAADNVTASYSRTAGETVGGSPYTISATLSPPSVLGNYTITYNTADFTITKRDATWTTNAAGKTYGDPDPNPLTTGSGSNFVAADNVTATYSRVAGETVLGSPYHITATLGPVAVLDNYNITNAGANFTIKPKAASVTPDATSKTYGDADPTFTGTLSGFLAADDVIASYSRTAGETVLGGPYTISATLSPAGVLSNYDITYNTASFTINPKAASVTPDAATKVLGAADPAFTGTLTGFLAGDNVTATYSRTPGETIGGNPYTISATLSPTGVLSNYNITYNTASFVITYATGGMCLGAPGHTILQPINSDGTSVFKQGSTVPAKFRVCDALGNSIGTPGVVFSFRLVKTVSGTVVSTIDEAVLSTTPDTAFRWSSTDQQWIFNLSTKKLAANVTYFYDITLNDGSHILFNFGLK